MNYKLLDPIFIGNVEIKNRIMYLAMVRGLCTVDNFITDKEIAYYKSLADGGVGLIIAGAMIIDPEWPSSFALQPGLYNDKFMPGLTKLADTIHESGAKVFFQMWHPGQIPYTPEAVPKTINDLSVEEIKEIQNKYFRAAKRVKAAGADGVEYQMCHTYLGNQFLSSHFNKRTDEYGADRLENGMRFSLEVISKIKEAVGDDFPISVKLNGSDFVPDGITPELAAQAAALLEKAGVSMISVSGGGQGTLLTGMSGSGEYEEGWKVPIANTVKAAVKKIPVAAMDNIRHPEFAEQCLREEKCDLIGIGRGLLADHEWVNKVKSGKEDQIRHCVSCMSCFNYSAPGDSGCSVNPIALRESEVEALNIDGNGRVVAVVGAGPAGLEAAVTLAERGYKPVIFEKGSRIGGMGCLAAALPNKYRFNWQIDYYQKAVERLNIEIKLNAEATEQSLCELNPYAVIVAAGSLPAILHIPGIERENVLQVRDVIENKPDIRNKNTVIVGSGMTGMETAEMLKGMDNHVLLIDILPQADPSNIPAEELLAYFKIITMGVEVKMSHKLLGIEEDGILAQNLETCAEIRMPADYVVLSMGVKANNELYEEIKDKFEKVFRIGDSDCPGKMANAVLAGSKIGSTL